MNKQEKSTVKIIPLGGMEQIGMNITLIEYEDNIIKDKIDSYDLKIIEALKNDFSVFDNLG